MAETSRALGGHPPAVEIGTDIESFLERLRAAGYAQRTLLRKQGIAWAFATWVSREQVALFDLNESHVAAFGARPPERAPKAVARELVVARSFLDHLRLEAGVSAPPLQADSSVPRALASRYAEYLSHERGLAERSICVYLTFIRDFIADREAKTGSAFLANLDASVVRDFLLHRVEDHGQASESTRLLATALRSFLRFLFLRGETSRDLSSSVPTVRKWRQATVPGYLSPEEVERILAVPDRATPRGRRDYAILLLLARLGLRAGEVVALELGDIRWRTAEIVVRGKGRTLDRLPLLSDIGQALAAYLQNDRGHSESRRVFVRKIAPLIGLAGPAAVGAVVRVGLAGAGLGSSRRGAAHLFRHSLATRMIRQGASMTEISEVLRHRATSTTAIYAKVDFETLRGVARRWPGTGGTR
jgi:site-specific recombinase XerD